jgi:hypothetical protein
VVTVSKALTIDGSFAINSIAKCATSSGSVSIVLFSAKPITAFAKSATPRIPGS